jgi:MORN repeat
MDSGKAKARINSATAENTKAPGGTAVIPDLEFVLGKTVVATKGTLRCGCLELKLLCTCCWLALTMLYYIYSEWMNGMAHGRGVETFPDGTVRHDGMWVEDEPVPNAPSSSS